ncbi:amino acid ABC transporter substrate-binding protein [Corallococcus sp. H22C18031201]|uniref:ABC transporter substrate-binding protein n=1 Tax=Citreicoccus inhibens TaxID=2849499 RepID=UPI000E744E08|nr:ABC transporter substrate-binding protein [Citreicoccus inhibens]MBU8900521.1 ABC transporter substrate-binding protein [Citreicoccus inhibens]RJS16570.1 amino acid ABC transporter substrate-binding protein [Corallococcus sp. H22C18031201]
MRALGFMAVGAVLFAGCSFTTASGLNECETSADCGANRVCTQGYCLPQPDGCDRALGATTVANAIPLGAVLPITTSEGTDESEEQDLNALKLALDEVNQLEGVGGRRFVLYVCDSHADTDRAKTQAEWMVGDKGVSAIFTSGSAQTISISTITIPKGVLLMSYTATSAAISNLSDKNGGSTGLVWRTTPSDVLQGRVIADILQGRIAINDPAGTFTAPAKVGVAYVNDAYGQGLYSALLDRFQPKQVPGVQYPRNGDVGTAVTQLVLEKANLTVLAGFPEDNTRIINQAVSAGLTQAAGYRWFFTDANKTSDLFTALGNNKAEVAGAYGTTPATERPNDSVYSLFAARFKTATNKDAGQYSYTAHAYDAMYLVALGHAYAVGPDINSPQPITGNRVAEGLTFVTPPPGANPAPPNYAIGPIQFTSARDELRAGHVINVRGASGELDFDNAKGEAPSQYELWKIENSKFTTLQLITPQAD